VSSLQRSANTLDERAVILTTTAQRHSDDSLTQVDTARQIEQAIEQLTHSMGQADEQLHHVSELTRQSASRAAETAQVIHAVEKVIDEQATGVKRVSSTISDLASLSQQISGMAGAIQSIAEQTNLL
ncbi:methyl-accepting chemotaxis protein, partial [Aeromonas hydrophila]